MKVFSQLESAQIENVVADPTPTATTVGRVIYRTDIDVYKICDATPAWRRIVSSLDETISFVGFATTPGTNPVAGSYKIYFKTDGKPYYLDENGIELPLGSGGGSGFNYIDNGEADADTSGWTLYNNTTAGVRPDDFGGVAAGLTFTRDIVAPLVGLGSFKLVKDAANRQGQGIYTPFSNETGHATLKMLLEMFTDSSHANITDGDLAIYLVGSSDSFVANFQVIEPSNPDVLAGVKQIQKQLQLLSGDLEYRLCIHVKSVNALAYDFYFDEVVLGPKSAASGAIVTDWENYTPSSSVVTNNVTYTGLSRRVGSDLEFQIRAEFSGTNTDGSYYVTIPSGLKIDVTKLASSSAPQFSNPVGMTMVHDTSANRYYNAHTVVNLNDGNLNTVGFLYEDDNIVGANPIRAALGSTSSNRPMIYASGDTVVFKGKVPIVGWSSNARMSEDFGSRDVYMRAAGNTQALTSGSTYLTYTSTQGDTTASFDGSTFTVPESGYYLMIMRAESGSTTNDFTFIGKVTIDGVANERFFDHRNKMFDSDNARMTGKGSMIKYLKKGQLVRTQIEIGGNLTMNAAEFTVIRLASPQQILETETVAARYESSNAQVLADSSFQTIKYESKDFDTHNAYNISTGEYTVPATGKYNIKAKFLLPVLNTANSSFLSITIDVGGLSKSREYPVYNANPREGEGFSVSDDLDLLKGDVVKIIGYQANGAGRALSNSGYRNTFSIARIK